MKRITQFLTRLFCRHEWVKIGFREELDEIHNMRYSVRRYKCQKCGKVVDQDGRYDMIGGIDGCP